jgi:hypothetical protein
MKKLLALLLVLSCTTANAGFVTGAIVGSAMLSNSSSSQQSTVLLSATHDLLTCKAVGDSYRDVPDEYCGYVLQYGRWVFITPAQYAKQLGYSFIYRRGVVFIDGTKHIVMEVSK